MECEKECNNFVTCRFSDEGSMKEHCNFFLPIRKKYKPKHKSIDELSQEAVICCVGIFNDFAEEETAAFSQPIQEAWRTGRDLVARQQDSDKMFNFSNFENFLEKD